MSIEKLKEKARRHEQNEEWQKALDQYNMALAELEREEQVDIGLYNRVGDLCVRVGDLSQAVDHYDKAVELYREAYLPNNAIAVCKKIIRNMPKRHQPYLVIGQIRAEQGFIPDARTNFLTYAERMQQDGQLDESFRALIEFCDLSPEDVGVRVTVADQMAASGRTDDAVEQLLIARAHFLQSGDQEQVEDTEKKVLRLDPDADLTAVPDVAGIGSSVDPDGDIIADFGDIEFGEGSETEAPPVVPDDLAAAAEGFVAAADTADEAMAEAVEESYGDFSIDSGASEDEGVAVPPIDLDGGGEEEDVVESPSVEFDDDAEEVVELPMMDFGDDADEGEVVELPMMDFGDEAEEEAAVELPMMDVGDEADEGEAVELPMMELGDEAEDEVAVELPMMDIGDEAEEEVAVELPSMDFGDEVGEEEAPELPSYGDAAEPTSVEAGFPEHVADDSVGTVTEAVQEAIEETAPAAAETPEAAEPPAEDKEEFVDLGAMILGTDEEKSTRFTVAYQEPTGDEEADFARMLSQFKEKVSENLDASDVRAHYDLGTAYKEMGLLDEAITSFQAALRASSDHLPTYELMGQTFIEMGQPEAAVRSLERATEVNSGVEDDLVGIYYYLARAHEELDARDRALEYYDRVFALDINFADVTERLRALR